MITNTRSIRAFAPGGLAQTDAEAPTQSESLRPAQADKRAKPRATFFRGVFIALAVAIPVWSWIILSILR